MRIQYLLVLAFCAACAEGEPANVASENVAASQVTSTGAVPVYQAETDGLDRRGRPMGRRDLILAYGRADPGTFFDRSAGKVDFAVADITGSLHRVDGPAGSLGFVTNVSEPLLGSTLSRDALVTQVSQKVAEQTGCVWTGQAATQINNSSKSFVTFLDC